MTIKDAVLLFDNFWDKVSPNAKAKVVDNDPVQTLKRIEKEMDVSV